MRGVVSLFFLIALVYADCKPYKNFFYDEERGWFWKENCPEKEKKEDTDKEKAFRVVIPWDKLDEMSPDEIKELQRKAEAIAIMHPTYENVREYKKLLLWIANKAREFAKMSYLVSMTDPEIASWLAQRPGTPYARRAYFKVKWNKVNEILERFKDKAGLVIFEREGCPYCEKQKVIADLFSERHGWTVKFVDVYEKPVAAQRLNVQMVPDIFLVLNKEGRPIWQRIATGLQTLSQLERSVVWGLYLLGEVKEDEVF